MPYYLAVIALAQDAVHHDFVKLGWVMESAQFHSTFVSPTAITKEGYQLPKGVYLLQTKGKLNVHELRDVLIKQMSDSGLTPSGFIIAETTAEDLAYDLTPVIDITK